MAGAPSGELPAGCLAMEEQIFSVLLPGIEEMLQVAKKTERRKCFNPLDYLSAYLYRHNPHFASRRAGVEFEDIPYVKEEWTKNPRPALPLSAKITEEEATTIIQAFFRGYLVRRESNVQLFRTWQRRVREEIEAAVKIQRFWRNHCRGVSKSGADSS